MFVEDEVTALRLEAVRKVYGDEDRLVSALDGVSLALARGSFTAIMGPSGSGKSTFLQCAAGLDRPTSGRVLIDDIELDGRNEKALTRFRRERVGFVFQQFNLVPTLTVLQNVMLPAQLAGRRPDRRHCVAVLERVGLGDRLRHRPAQLSGGQQQRVAIARALVTEPRLLFADEPTGALDSTSAREVLELLTESVRQSGQTLVMVTHDPVAAAYADRVLFLADGQIVGELVGPTPEKVVDRMLHLEAAAIEPDIGVADIADRPTSQPLRPRRQDLAPDYPHSRRPATYEVPSRRAPHAAAGPSEPLREQVSPPIEELAGKRTPRPALPAPRPTLAERGFRPAGFVFAGFGLNLLAFLLVAVLFSLGAATLIVWVGLPVLYLAIRTSRWLATANRRLIRRTLGVRIPEPAEAGNDTGSGWQRQLRPLTRSRTWREAGYLLLALPLHVLELPIAIVGSICLPLGAVTLPAVAALHAKLAAAVLGTREDTRLPEISGRPPASQPRGRDTGEAGRHQFERALSVGAGQRPGG